MYNKYNLILLTMHPCLTTSNANMLIITFTTNKSEVIIVYKQGYYFYNFFIN